MSESTKHPSKAVIDLILASDDKECKHPYQDVLQVRVVVHDYSHHPYVRQVPAQSAEANAQCDM